MVKKLKILEYPIEEELGTPDFCRAKVLPDIFNHSNFECSVFSGLKVDSMERKKKKSNKKETKQEK